MNFYAPQVISDFKQRLGSSSRVESSVELKKEPIKEQLSQTFFSGPIFNIDSSNVMLPKIVQKLGELQKRP